jgi:hypothetical protein
MNSTLQLRGFLDVQNGFKQSPGSGDCFAATNAPHKDMKPTIGPNPTMPVVFGRNMLYTDQGSSGSRQ